ncbi:hypothetical protein B0A49_05345 [Cryomyces minteri]|uniref:Uncharacterized protein n=1 Tax=Cryomyces minteri TaxID=331657 RepID=A0A4U0X1H0_9PEZI|nr:hypothetical protein B0A49_05345 [Cryomyces minteri]
MSQYGDYDDGPRRQRTHRTRPRERGDPEYVQETTYIERGHGAPPRDLVYRPREDSVEDIPREFPPAEAAHRRTRQYENYDPPRRRAKSVGRGSYYGDDDRYPDYAGPAGGAAAGYAAGRARNGRRDRRRDDRDDYYSDDGRSPRRRERKKSGVGEVLEGLGLGGIVGGLVGGSRSKSRDRDRDRGDRGHRRGGRYDDDSRSRSRDRGGKSERKWAQAAQAAIVAGAIEAFRSRNEPGPWTGEKGRRIATAALGAGGIDGLVDHDPDKKSKRHLAEAVIGGLAANHFANGPREKDRDMDGDGSRSRSRSRSAFGGRSQSRGGAEGDGGGAGALKGLAAGGALAAAGKAIYDRVRSKSRRRRSPSASSEDSYAPPSRRGRYNDRRSRDGGYDNDDNQVARSGGGGANANNNGENRKRSNSSDSSSSASTTDMEDKKKKMRGKELLTAGLATIATIHAAHGIYSSMAASDKRHKLVDEGAMSPEEARKKKSKAWLQDAAAVGIAALGIKGAFSEWKEMTEQRHSIHELEVKKRQRERRRKEERERMQNGMDGAYGNGVVMMPVAQPLGQPLGQPLVYADGNPYAAGGLPPPPMGGPIPRY